MKDNVRYYKYGKISTDNNNVRVKVYDNLYQSRNKETTHENIYITQLGESHFCVEADRIMWEYVCNFYGSDYLVLDDCKDNYREDWIVFEEEYVGRIRKLFGKKPEKHWYGKRGYIPLKETEPTVFEFFGTLLIEDRR